MPGVIDVASSCRLGLGAAIGLLTEHLAPDFGGLLAAGGHRGT